MTDTENLNEAAGSGLLQPRLVRLDGCDLSAHSNFSKAQSALDRFTDASAAAYAMELEMKSKPNETSPSVDAKD